MLIIYFVISIIISLSIYFVRRKLLTSVLLIVFLLIQAALAVYSYLHLGQTDSAFFKFGSLGILFAMILTLLSFTSFYYSVLYLKEHPEGEERKSFYYTLLILLIAAMTGAYFAENMAILWVCIETTTLFVAGLVNFDKTKIALEAAWKYLFIASFGVAIAFVGILFLSIVSGGNDFIDFNFTSLIVIAGNIDPLWLKISFALVLTGFSAKMGIFPLYSAAIDAHTVAPPPVSAFISTSLMNVGFLAIFKVYEIIAQTAALAWAQNVLMIAGVLSLSLSAVQLLKIKHFKRMFAFSSLEHMGIVCIGLAVGGIGYYAAILHLIFHSLVKAGMFYQISKVHSAFGSYWIKDSGSYIKQSPVNALVLLLSMVLITAIPPSGLFVSEFMVFKGLFMSNNILIAIVALFLLTIIIFVIGKQILHLLYSPTPENHEAIVDKGPNYSVIPVLILFALSIYIGVHPPEFISDLINSSIELLK